MPGLEPQTELRRRLDWLFPLLLALPLAGTVWAYSGPGSTTIASLVALGTLVIFGVAWLYLVYEARRRGRPLTWYGVAAVLTVVVLLLVVLQVPRHARWMASRPAFDRLAAQLRDNPDLSVSGWIGWYEVGQLQYVEGGWIVYEAGGSGMFDDAGFAYLPAGPTNDLGDVSWESPQFVHLGGPWYSWTASW